MPKLQYNSENDSDDEPVQEVVEPVKKKYLKKNKVIEPVIESIITPVEKQDVIKPKRQQSEAQKQNTIKMREALKVKRDSDLRIKEQVKLENEMLKQQIKKKTMKQKVDEKVSAKLKQIAESSSDDSENDEEEKIIVQKVKSKVVIPKVKQIVKPVTQVTPQQPVKPSFNIRFV